MTGTSNAAALCRPPLLLRSGNLQTFLASAGLRARGANPLLACAREQIVATPGGVRLLGSLSAQGRGRAKGLVFLLHGWEGSMDSTYVRCTGRALFTAGYDVFRLNFRDHGASHHLNPGIFYAVQLDEVFEAVAAVAARHPGLPVFLVGFSLGGNFVLRIVRRCAQQPLPGLTHAVAISPVLDPETSTANADRHPLIRRYFLKKWRRSLRIKQRLHPELYDFGDVLAMPSILAATEALLRRHSDYPSARDYFKAYGLTGGALADLPVSTTLVTSRDDPIIPAADFQNLKVNARTRVEIHPHGGHNGFLTGWGLKSHYETAIPGLFDDALNAIT
jgi:predicted alpha/beta-fold hydrolase